MKKTVLIADDSQFMRNRLKDLLSNDNFKVVAEASNGCEAINLFQEVCPDVVLLDIVMPHKNGLDALYEMKKHNPKAKVVICSSMGQKNLIIEALKLGASDFIVKPFFNNLIPILKKITG
ncbi:two-component system response regulator [Bacillus methanolicus]|uniref:response regulator n=1 Tax=Bacillus methanolicus TaxID=1471 RepID=UPI00200F8899|nr:response regulator [Bacillus methanolicus]UQD52327.1 two-component system response regulator [Bacillus methanolicus]